MDYLTLPWPLLPARQSFADIYNFSKWIGDNNFANQILSFAQPLVQRDKTMQWVYDVYNWLWGFLQNIQWQRWDVYEKINNDTLWRLAQWFELINNLYWPQWSEIQKVNDYYTNYAKYLAAKRADEGLYNSAIASKFWLSQNYLDNANKNQELKNQEMLFKTFWEQDQRLGSLNKLYMDYLNQYNANVWQTQDKYVIWYADQVAKNYQDLATWLTNNLIANEEAKQNFARQLALMNRSQTPTYATSTNTGIDYNKKIQDLANSISNSRDKVANQWAALAWWLWVSLANWSLK